MENTDTSWENLSLNVLREYIKGLLDAYPSHQLSNIIILSAPNCYQISLNVNTSPQMRTLFSMYPDLVSSELEKRNVILKVEGEQ